MWDQIQGSTDTLLYFALASLATLLFLGRLALVLIGMDGSDHGGDFDVTVLDDGGGAGDVSDHGQGHTHGAFALFSTLSVLAFFMGAGWMGLAARITWQLGPGASGLASLGFGFACMLLAAFLMSNVYRLNKEVSVDMESCVGEAAQVYLTVPPKGRGRGQVRVTVSGRSRIFPAESSGPELPAFATVTVVSVRPDRTVIVAPVG